MYPFPSVVTGIILFQVMAGQMDTKTNNLSQIGMLFFLRRRVLVVGLLALNMALSRFLDQLSLHFFSLQVFRRDEGRSDVLPRSSYGIRRQLGAPPLRGSRR